MTGQVEDVRVPVRTDIRADEYRRLYRLAQEHKVSINELVGELVHRSLMALAKPARMAVATEAAAPVVVAPEPVQTRAKWAVRRTTDGWVAVAPSGETTSCVTQADAFAVVSAAVAPKPRGGTAADHEAEIRALHAAGKSDGAIARSVGLAQPTVSSFRRRLGLSANFRKGGKS